MDHVVQLNFQRFYRLGAREISKTIKLNFYDYQLSSWMFE